MSLLNERVIHSGFGTGTVISCSEKMIRVRFEEPIGEKAFVYPDIFVKFIRPERNDLNTEIQADITAKCIKTSIENEQSIAQLAKRQEQVKQKNNENHELKLERMRQRKKSMKSNTRV